MMISEKKTVATKSCNTQAFGQSTIDQLKMNMIVRKLPSSTVLFREGEKAGFFYLILRGTVKMMKTMEDGRQMTFAIYHSGDMIGTIEPMQVTNQTMDAVIMEDAEIGVIPIQHIESIMLSGKKTSIEFLHWMGQTRRYMESKFRDMLFFGKTGALASLMIRMTNSHGVKTGQGWQVPMKLSNTELAEMIGATRESVNRTLNDWRSSGFIEFTLDRLTIHRLEELKKLCQCEQCPIEICRL